ncbi:MAG: macro domain-containing protein [Sphingomonadales bacterium]|jgi:O-acetyl-ADP-ribose deacetylase (regulator of RNase III)
MNLSSSRQVFTLNQPLHASRRTADVHIFTFRGSVDLWASSAVQLSSCRKIGRCEIGSAVITPAFRLPSKFVTHAVGPRWMDGRRGAPHLRRRCYQSNFELADDYPINSLVAPSISTGIYHYPLDAAVKIAIEVSKQFDRQNLNVTFVCFDERTLAEY